MKICERRLAPVNEMLNSIREVWFIEVKRKTGRHLFLGTSKCNGDTSTAAWKSGNVIKLD